MEKAARAKVKECTEHDSGRKTKLLDFLGQKVEATFTAPPPKPLEPPAPPELPPPPELPAPAPSEL
eukprot:122542-Prymnesium_polylepis.1